MTPPLTSRPGRPQESVVTDESTSTQIFGVMYITLTGLIDSMAPTSRPWAILGKLLSYIVKLAPILWWALPAGPAGRLPASPQEPPTGWVPDSFHLFELIHAQLNLHRLPSITLSSFITKCTSNIQTSGEASGLSSGRVRQETSIFCTGGSTGFLALFLYSFKAFPDQSFILPLLFSKLTSSDWETLKSTFHFLNP
ncbi:hypothetical protein DSO57_1017150 [Entomophthora muscae]|uniref:Uncharacterized protein n=1 Tax=Entomophthora muscae TaxID=34485 RepID=A0ACC2S6T8_9FUNG|nr:hypothetical protein DSO57_1017150 [Entomophthora muscae]